ncbi:hypothetical protein MKW98_001568, partial [Papaver atlanticum]
VGKSRLIRSLVKRYNKKNINKLYMQGPVTIISGRLLIDYRCSRDIVLYGYLRGCDIKKGAK